MKSVLDTNVLMSATLFGRVPGRILGAWRAGRVELAMSPDIVDEFVRDAERFTKRHPDVDLKCILALVVGDAEVVPIIPLSDPVCDDPDDDEFPACAIASGVAIVVSDHKKLRAVSGHEGICVRTPRHFADHWL